MQSTLELVLFTASLVLLAEPSVTAETISIGIYDESFSEFLSPEDVPFARLSHINYAFAVIDSNYKPVITAEGAVLLIKLVDEAQKKNNVKVSLSIGGLNGSKYFSAMAAQVNRRAIFINEVITLIRKYELDGVDIVWVYPGRKGLSCNPVDKQNDANNFLLLLREMKLAFAVAFILSSKLITLTVRVTPFDINDTPMTDVSAFARNVDFICIMAYDINVASATTGPNAPFNFAAGKGAPYSFTQAISSWLDAKVPANQLVVGFPFYGRASTATVDMSQDSTNIYVSKSNVTPMGDQNDEMSFDSCGLIETYSGIWKYRNLRDQGLLTSPTTAGNGWTRYWDSDSQTPWLFNPVTKVFITYDDVESIQIKAKYAEEKGLGGTMIWALHQDKDNELANAMVVSTSNFNF